MNPKNDNKIPTYNFFEREIESEYDVEEILENFVFSMEKNYFLMWEAVVNKEKNKELTEIQEQVFNQLLNFGDEDDEQILYIDECARPNKAWYLIAQEIAEKMVVKNRIACYELHSSLFSEGWETLKEGIINHGEHLSKPSGIKDLLEVIPEEIRHQLEIQEAIDWLIGLGQDSQLTLTDPEQNYRIGNLIKSLKDKISSVEYFKLSIKKLLTDFVELHPKDEEIFKREMINILGLINEEEYIAEKLKKISDSDLNL